MDAILSKRRLTERKTRRPADLHRCGRHQSVDEVLRPSPRRMRRGVREPYSPPICEAIILPLRTIMDENALAGRRRRRTMGSMAENGGYISRQDKYRREFTTQEKKEKRNYRSGSSTFSSLAEAKTHSSTFWKLDLLLQPFGKMRISI